MKFTQFKSSLQSDGFAPVYLFEGEELYFREKGLETLKADVKMPEFNFVCFDGGALKGARIKELASAVAALPFLSDRRLVAVRDFYPTEKEYAAYLQPLFDSPVQTSVLAIFNESAGKGKAGSVEWKKKPNVTVVDCARAAREDVLKWIYLTLRKAGIAAGADCCDAIADYCVSDMARISREVEKIVAAYPSGGTLDRATVDALVYRDTAYKMYELTQAAARKDYGGFVRIMDGMVGKGYDENDFLSALCSQFKTLYEVKVSRGTDKTVAEKLSMKEYAVKKSREAAARFSVDALGEYYTAIYQTLAAARAGEISFPAALKTVVAKIFFENYEK